ncbi:hypothetical protein DFS34DRAFT_66024 [Phlyctochytrium arcticum]|nr:hypothetical protein DFS34DRAFT_66024 [Phlyctochytrium arcticum]
MKVQFTGDVPSAAKGSSSFTQRLDSLPTSLFRWFDNPPTLSEVRQSSDFNNDQPAPIPLSGAMGFESVADEKPCSMPNSDPIFLPKPVSTPPRISTRGSVAGLSPYGSRTGRTPSRRVGGGHIGEISPKIVEVRIGGKRKRQGLGLSPRKRTREKTPTLNSQTGSIQVPKPNKYWRPISASLRRSPTPPIEDSGVRRSNVGGVGKFFALVLSHSDRPPKHAGGAGTAKDTRQSSKSPSKKVAKTNDDGERNSQTEQSPRLYRTKSQLECVEIPLKNRYFGVVHRKSPSLTRGRSMASRSPQASIEVLIPASPVSLQLPTATKPKSERISASQSVEKYPLSGGSKRSSSLDFSVFEENGTANKHMSQADGKSFDVGGSAASIEILAPKSESKKLPLDTPNDQHLCSLGTGNDEGMDMQQGQALRSVPQLQLSSEMMSKSQSPAFSTATVQTPNSHINETEPCLPKDEPAPSPSECQLNGAISFDSKRRHSKLLVPFSFEEDTPRQPSRISGRDIFDFEASVEETQRKGIRVRRKRKELAPQSRREVRGMSKGNILDEMKSPRVSQTLSDISDAAPTTVAESKGMIATPFDTEFSMGIGSQTLLHIPYAAAPNTAPENNGISSTPTDVGSPTGIGSQTLLHVPDARKAFSRTASATNSPKVCSTVQPAVAQNSLEINASNEPFSGASPVMFRTPTHSQANPANPAATHTSPMKSMEARSQSVDLDETMLEIEKFLENDVDLFKDVDLG